MGPEIVKSVLSKTRIILEGWVLGLQGLDLTVTVNPSVFLLIDIPRFLTSQELISRFLVYLADGKFVQIRKSHHHF